MRTLFGMILGACVVIGGAFLHDGRLTSAGSETVDQRPMVNWDVVGENWRVVRQKARDGWTTLSHKVSS